MDGPQEYEVESVTRARVYGKRGKKITWKYYVKWKGYGWDECTWEPTDSFQEGSEHILESFWERIDTGGRDISDASAFKKGEELLVSGPPGKKSLKRKASSTKIQVAPAPEEVPSSNGVTISAPLLTTRKRRRVQVTVDGKRGYTERRGGSKDGAASNRLTQRRRASSPGPRKQAPKRQPSAGDSQLDADGETDPDVVEVEDELMQVGPEDADEDTDEAQQPVTASGSANGSNRLIFDDLEHFYSGNPIDIDQPTEDQRVIRKQEGGAPPPAATIPPSDDAAPDSPTSPALSASDPLFDSPPLSPDKPPETQQNPVLPHHRARAANPLVKLIDTTALATTSKQSRITAKARLMSIHATDATSTSGPSRNAAKRGGKPGSSQSSPGLLTRNRSSLLTATKGTLQSVKGKFTRTTIERDQPDEIEDDPGAHGASLYVTSWSDGDMAGQETRTTSNAQSILPPSGEELLKLAGLQTDTDPGTLPDYEDPPARPQEDQETQDSEPTSALVGDELSNRPPIEVCKTDGQVADSSPIVSEAEQRVSASVDDSATPSTDVLAVDKVKKNIELAKEHLFPSAQMSFNSFSTPQSSFRSTIFGPLYQGSGTSHVPPAETEFSTAFRVIFGDGTELPLVLKDCNELKARISDILIGNSSGSKVALFYSAEDALAMVSTFKSDGTARAVLDHSATTTQQEHFSIFLQRFVISQTLVAPVGKEVCVLYSSENNDIAEKLGAPSHLRGLSGTLLISHASIENQLGYVAAIMKATAL